MPEHRRYTKRQKAETVAQALMTNTDAAAEKTGIPRSTIVYWLAQPEFDELRRKTREDVADRMWAVVQLGVEEVAKGLTGDAPLRDKAVALGVIYDKHALLTGGATARSETRGLSGISDADIIDGVRTAEHLLAAGRAAREAEAPPEG